MSAKKENTFSKWWADNHETLNHRDILRACEKAYQAGWQAHAEQQWISVTTALPELKDDSVLAHFANGSIETVHIQDYFGDITSGFDENGNQRYTKWYLHSDPPVTHWMPLPQPPKEKL